MATNRFIAPAVLRYLSSAEDLRILSTLFTSMATDELVELEMLVEELRFVPVAEQDQWFEETMVFARDLHRQIAKRLELLPLSPPFNPDTVKGFSIEPDINGKELNWDELQQKVASGEMSRAVYDYLATMQPDKAPKLDKPRVLPDFDSPLTGDKPHDKKNN